ncbi:hypothetical protein JW826_02035 [Candidatus Woesearchaeota archaeon]|nr:hypothetical protein [Candidatus Woesearchaeota archaeon]
MACFSAPSALALATTVFRKKFPEHWHISWLNTMIWGGAVALAVEHVAHGEIVPWPPFLTAMSSPVETVVMLKEIAAVGIPMTLALVLVWVLMVVVYERFIASAKSPAATRAALR